MLFFIVTCFWSVIVILFDGSIGHQLLQQFESSHYPSEPGQITHSQVTRHRGSKGRTSYGVDVRYRYVVKAEDFTNWLRQRLGLSNAYP